MGVDQSDWGENDPGPYDINRSKIRKLISPISGRPYPRFESGIWMKRQSQRPQIAFWRGTNVITTAIAETA